MRLENGPVPQEHKDAGKALAEEMEDALTKTMLRASREVFVDTTRRDLHAAVARGFHAGKYARDRLARLERAERSLRRLPLFRTRSHYVLPEGQWTDFVSLRGLFEPGARHALKATPRAAPYALHGLPDASGK